MSSPLDRILSNPTTLTLITAHLSPHAIYQCILVHSTFHIHFLPHLWHHITIPFQAIRSVVFNRYDRRSIRSLAIPAQGVQLLLESFQELGALPLLERMELVGGGTLSSLESVLLMGFLKCHRKRLNAVLLGGISVEEVFEKGDEGEQCRPGRGRAREGGGRTAMKELGELVTVANELRELKVTLTGEATVQDFGMLVQCCCANVEKFEIQCDLFIGYDYSCWLPPTHETRMDFREGAMVVHDKHGAQVRQLVYHGKDPQMTHELVRVLGSVQAPLLEHIRLGISLDSPPVIANELADTLRNSCPRLKSLDLVQSSGEALVEFLSECCPSLEELTFSIPLSLWEFKSLSQGIVRGHGQTLRVLNMQRGYSVPVENILEILHGCPKLERLYAQVRCKSPALCNRTGLLQNGSSHSLGRDGDGADGDDRRLKELLSGPWRCRQSMYLSFH